MVGYSSVYPALLERVGDKMQVRCNITDPDPDDEVQAYRFEYVEIDVADAAEGMTVYYAAVSQLVAERRAMSEEVGILRKTMAGLIEQVSSLSTALSVEIPDNPYAQVFADYHQEVEILKSTMKQTLGQ